MHHEPVTRVPSMSETNQKQANIIPLFPTPVVLTNISRKFTEDELRFIEDLPMYIDAYTGMKNHRSNSFYLFDDFAEELKNIKRFCEYQLKNYLEHIDGTDTDKISLQITQSWLNLTKPQEFHYPHYHPNSYLSGVLYIKCLPDDHITFTDRLFGFGNNNLEFPIKKPTAWNAMGFGQSVSTGDLILFPSWVTHSVDVNETEVNRISLSFNTFPVGEIGNNVSNNIRLLPAERGEL